MSFLEKDLENIIWESDNEKLREKGLKIYGKKFRQIRIGNYGVADLITVERKIDCYFNNFLDITVYELKKEKAGISAFLQAIRYCKGIQTYMLNKRSSTLFKLNIVLCAKNIDTESDYIFISDLISSDEYEKICSVHNYSFNYGIDGIVFKQKQNYNLIDKGF